MALNCILAPALAALILLISAEVSHATDAVTAPPRDLQPLVTTSELIVGPNRFVFGLLQEGRLLEGADVRLRIYSIERTRAFAVAETDALYHPVGAVQRGDRVHRHADGTKHVHRSGSDVRGLYIAQIHFARSGQWGVEIQARQGDGPAVTARMMVTVQELPPTPVVGSPAPRSRNLIIGDVKHLRQIDTSSPPDPRLHRVRIADAIAQKKPQVIVFATPQFCTSRMCGPVVDVVRSLLPAWGKRVAFIHQEIWQDFAEKKMFQTVEEWRLETEPWVFVVDGAGIIRAKFEGLATVRELDDSLRRIVARSQ